MGCTVKEFFGLRLCDADFDGFAEAYGSPRAQSQLLVFADRRSLWKGILSSRFRAMFGRDRVFFAPHDGDAARPVRLATGCAVGPFPEFRTLVRLLSRAEQDNATLFLVAESAAILSRAEENLRATFPDLRLVGRAVYTVRQEDSIATAIRKAAPTVLVVGSNSRRVYSWISPLWQKLEHALTIIAPRAIRKMAGVSQPIRPLGILLFPLRVFDLVPLFGHRLSRARRVKKAGV